MSNYHHHLLFISVATSGKTYSQHGKDNSAAQYEVVAVDDEDGVQWRRWHQRQRSTALKTKTKWWRGKDGVWHQRRWWQWWGGGGQHRRWCWHQRRRGRLSSACLNLLSCLITPSWIGWTCRSRHNRQWVALGLGLSFLLSLSICWHWGIKCYLSDIGEMSFIVKYYSIYISHPCWSLRIISDYEFFTGEVSLLWDGAVGACMIQASAHVRLACGGAVNLLPYALTWSLTLVSGNLSPRGAGLCTLLY